jgi:hypothetical protein
MVDRAAALLTAMPWIGNTLMMILMQFLHLSS